MSAAPEPYANGSNTPPSERLHSVSAEEHVLGGLLLDASFDLVAGLTAEDFYRNENQLIFAALADCAREGLPLDCATVAERLERKGHLQAVGGLAALSALLRDTSTSARIKIYAARVRHLASQRRLRDRLEDPLGDNDLVESLDRELARLRAGMPGEGLRKLASINFGEMKPHLSDGYIVKGLIVPNTLAAVIGQTGSGKTFFSTDLSLHLAARHPWRGRKVRGGLVVYAALEGPTSAENRFVAARNSLGFARTLPLCLTPGPLNLRDPADVTLLITFIRAAESDYGEKCVAVFVDTLSRAMAGGDENGSDHMGALIAGADAVRLATGATVVLVHHMGKDESRGARGHSSLKAALDTEIEVAAKDNAHVATVTKQRDLPTGGQFAFRLKVVELGQDEDGDPVTSCVVEPVDDVPSDRRGPRGKNQTALLVALQEWRRAQPAGTSGLLTAIELREIAKVQRIGRNRLQEAVEGLEKFGWLQSTPGGYHFLAEEPR